MKYFISLLAFFFILGSTYSQVITATGSTTFCEGKSVVLSVTGAPGGSSYQWIWDGKNVGTGATYTATQSGSYSVIVTTGGVSTTLTPIVVVSNPRPVVNFTFSDSTCSGIPVQFNATVSNGTAPFTYLWTFGGGGTSTDQNPVHVFTSLGCGVATFSNNLTVTDANGCTSNPVVKSIKILMAPDVQLQDLNAFSPFNNCDNYPTEANPDYLINVKNISPSSSCISSYNINWGDGIIQTGLTSINTLAHTYKKIGAFNLTITGIGKNGCSNSKTYIIANLRSPGGGLGTLPGTTGLCTPDSIHFTITNWQLNSPGTLFKLDYDDGRIDTLQYPLNQYFTVDTITHTYNTSSCPRDNFIARLTVINACPTNPDYTASNIQIRQKPKAYFSVPGAGCAGKQFCFKDSSTLGSYGSNCSSATVYTWNYGDGSKLDTIQNGCHTYAAVGTYTVTLTTSNPCGQSSFSRQVCVIPPAKASFTISDSIGCAPFTVKTTNTSDTSTCGPSTFQWDILSYTAGYCGTSSLVSLSAGASASATNSSFDFKNAGTYVIRLLIMNPCGNVSFTKTVTVKKEPTVSQPADTIACGPVTFNPRLLVPTCETGLTKYAWIFAGGSPGSSSLLNPGSITFADTGRHVISLTTSNACGDTTVSRVLTINPPPNVIAPNDTGICANLPSGAFTFASSATGTTYSWTNNNTSIGLAASGTGNIASFKTLNSTALPVAATVKVTATKSGCTSPADSLKITVYPTPGNPTVPLATVNYCQGDPAVPLVATAAPGDTLIWYTTPTGGTGSRIPPTPQTTLAGDSNFYVSQKNSSGCESGRSTIVVKVGAKPKITTFSFTNPTSCGATDGTITLSGLTPNTSYTVQYAKNGGTPVSVPMTTNAAGNIIIRALGAGTYTNVGVGSVGCFATVSNTFELVDPNAPAAPKAGSVAALCSGNSINLTASTTLTGVVTFAWTGPNGYTSSVQNPVINTATVAASGIYYVVVKQNNCTSKPDSVMVSVTQTPARPTVSANILLCSKDTLKLLASLDPNDGITYLWSGPNGFTSTQQNPAIPNASTANNGTYSVTATRGNCVSPAATSIVSVKPAATITSTSFVHPSCGAINGTITLNGLSANTSYPVQYTKNGTAVSTTALSEGTGTVILRSLDAGTYASIIVLTNGCPSNAAGPITLQNTPAFTASPTSNSPLCIDNALQLKAGSIINENAVYSWTGPDGFKSTLRDPVISHVSQSDTGTYYVTVTVNGCSATGSVAVTVLQNAIGGTTDADATVCSGTNTGNISLSGYSGRIIRWESSVNNGATWNSISNTSTSFTYNNLVATTWFRVLIQNTTCNPVFSDTTIITVNTNTEVPKFDPFSLTTCSHDTVIRFTATVNNPGNSALTYKWFINDQIQGVSNPFSYRFRVPTQSANAAQFNIKVLAEYSTGCGDTSQTGIVRINPLPVASINVSPGLIQYQPNYSFIFKDTTANINRIYNWNMGDGNQGSGKEITYEYGDVGNYLVRLNVNDISTGCSARDSVRIIIIPVAGSLYVPNAFYPNSKKNVLTTFKLAATGLEKFHLQVFDTWGKLLFETTELNTDGSPKISWNGTYFNNGTPLPQDAYVWKIVEAKFKNGKDWEGMSYNGGPAKRIGTVTLFR